MPFFDNNRTLIIAEVAQAHDGSLGQAHAFIDAAADAGADVVKFQTHFADEESSPDEPWRVHFSKQDETRMDYWRRMEFGESQWRELKAHSVERGLLFASSPFSIKAIELLDQLEVPFWKIASGEVNNFLLLRHMLETNRPILLSSGMSSWAELDATVGRIQESGSELAILQCTTAYPCPPEKWGLNLISELKSRFDCPVGLSDHSGTTTPSIAAVAMGATILEIHLTFSKRMFGPDTPASLTVEEFAEMVNSVRDLEAAKQNPVQKDEFAKGAASLRQTFGQSLVARRDLSEGTELKFEDFSCRKPGNGLPAGDFERFVGKTLTSAIAKGQLIREDCAS